MWITRIGLPERGFEGFFRSIEVFPIFKRSRFLEFLTSLRKLDTPSDFLYEYCRLVILGLLSSRSLFPIRGTGRSSCVSVSRNCRRDILTWQPYTSCFGHWHRCVQTNCASTSYALSWPFCPQAFKLCFWHGRSCEVEFKNQGITMRNQWLLARI